jgi:hypothetical protein
VKGDLPLYPAGRYQIIHAVKAAQHRTLTTAGWANKSRYLVGWYFQVNITDRQVGSIVDMEVFCA